MLFFRIKRARPSLLHSRLWARTLKRSIASSCRKEGFWPFVIKTEFKHAISKLLPDFDLLSLRLNPDKLSPSFDFLGHLNLRTFFSKWMSVNKGKKKHAVVRFVFDSFDIALKNLWKKRNWQNAKDTAKDQQQNYGTSRHGLTLSYCYRRSGQAHSDASIYPAC